MMITNKKTGIYIHIPFCEKKCNYCGFYSHQGAIADIDEYISLVVAEIEQKGRAYAAKREADTIFIGGGTPSVLKPEHIKKIFDALYKNFNVDSNAEITIEVNPNSISKEKLKIYKDCKINRLSIGAQSFDDILLKKLGRLHKENDTKSAFNLAREEGFKNINLDLMFGIPNQTTEAFEKTLDEAIKLNPEHISCYSLQIEQNTPFYEKYKYGKLSIPNDNMTEQMYMLAIDKLKNAGYAQYEISNFAKKGMECKHNLKYWQMEDFIGIGATACGYIDGYRYENDKGEKYCDIVINKPENISDKEQKSEAMSIFCFTSLRLTSGLNTAKFEERFGLSLGEAFPGINNIIREYNKKGYLVVDDNFIRLTTLGFLHSNEIMCEFV